MAMNPPEPYKGVAYGLFLGFFICLISLVFAFLLACIDAYADRVENKKAIIYMSGCFDKDENLYNKTFNENQ